MSRILKILCSLPGTVWFNFRYLPFSQALKLPIWIAGNTRIKNMYRGGIKFENNQVRLGQVRIGYHEADAVDTSSAHTLINISDSGQIIIKDDVHIGQGAILNVKQNAVLYLGKNFAISGTTSIICNNRIVFGDDVQLSWNSLIADGDAHEIYSESGGLINPKGEIIIGNKVWIAANTTVLKGSVIQDNTVVASNSLVNRNIVEGSCIIGGCPAKVLKKIGWFEI